MDLVLLLTFVLPEGRWSFLAPPSTTVRRGQELRGAAPFICTAPEPARSDGRLHRGRRSAARHSSADSGWAK